MDVDRARDHLQRISHAKNMTVEQRAIAEEGMRAIDELKQKCYRYINDNYKLRRDNAHLKKYGERM